MNSDDSRWKAKTASAVGLIDGILMELPDNIIDSNDVEELFESLARDKQDALYRELEAAQQVLAKAQTQFRQTLKGIRRKIVD